MRPCSRTLSKSSPPEAYSITIAKSVGVSKTSMNRTMFGCRNIAWLWSSLFSICIVLENIYLLVVFCDHKVLLVEHLYHERGRRQEETTTTTRRIYVSSSSHLTTFSSRCFPLGMYFMATFSPVDLFIINRA